MKRCSEKYYDVVSVDTSKMHFDEEQYNLHDTLERRTGNH